MMCSSSLVLTLTVVWLLVGLAEGGQDTLALFRNSPLCDHETHLLFCNISGRTESAEIVESNWGTDITSMMVIGASSLDIKPQCDAEDKDLYVFISKNVKTLGGDQDCLVHLHLDNSTANSITEGANLLKSFNSRLHKVDLHPVDSFTFTGSNVHDLSITTTRHGSVISNSHVDLLRKLEVKGSFSIRKSNVSQIQSLIYNTTTRQLSMTGVNVARVERNGIVVNKGILTMDEVIITSLAPGGITVEEGDALKLKNSEITNTGVDGVIMRGGNITCENVTIGSRSQIYFSIETPRGTRRSFKLQPFATVLCASCPTSYGLVVGLPISTFLLGILVRISCFVLIRRRARATEGDAMRESQPSISLSQFLSSTTPSEQTNKNAYGNDEGHSEAGGSISPMISVNHLPKNNKPSATKPLLLPPSSVNRPLHQFRGAPLLPPSPASASPSLTSTRYIDNRNDLPPPPAPPKDTDLVDQEDYLQPSVPSMSASSTLKQPKIGERFGTRTLLLPPPKPGLNFGPKMVLNKPSMPPALPKLPMKGGCIEDDDDLEPYAELDDPADF